MVDQKRYVAREIFDFINIFFKKAFHDTLWARLRMQNFWIAIWLGATLTN